MITISLNTSAINAALGANANLSVAINDKEITEAGVNFTDSEFLNISPEDKLELETLLAKGFVVVLSDGSPITDLSSMESMTGGTVPVGNFTDLNVTNDALIGGNAGVTGDISGANVEATTGDVVATLGDVIANGNVEATTGDVTAPAGSIIANTDVEATTGDVKAPLGALSGLLMELTSVFGSNFKLNFYEETVTIAVGAGMAGVATLANLVPAASVLVCAFVHVRQAPGGGATTLDVGRTLIAVDELADGIAVALDTKTNSWLHAVPVAFVHNVTADTLTLTTDANVTVSDMLVNVSVLVAEAVN